MFLIQEIIVKPGVYQDHFVCDLNVCKGACCWEGEYGAPLSLKEIDLLSKNYLKIKKFLSEESIEFIEKNGFARYYKDIKKWGTSVLNDGKCVFLNRGNDQQIGSCAIEECNRELNIDFIKPISCHLYPIRISKNELNGMIEMNVENWEICDAARIKGRKLDMKAFQFLKDAIIRQYGSEFYTLLNTMADKFSVS